MAPPPAALRCEAGGAALLALLPAIVTAANRSSPLVVALAATSFLAGAILRDPAAARSALLGPLGTAAGIAALAFLAWCGTSIAWSAFPPLSLRVASEFAPTLVASYVLARLAPGRIPAFAAPLAAIAVGLAAIYIASSLALGLPVQRALGQRVADFVFNRPAMTILLVTVPLAQVLVLRGLRWPAAGMLVLGCAGILRSVSGAAAMGLIAAAAMFALARTLPRAGALGLAGAGLVLAMALAPVEGEILSRAMPEAVHERLVQSSSRARVAIARSFGAIVAAEPWSGTGYGTAARMAETPAAARIEEGLRAMLPAGHPHNTFLQVWAELGLPGAVLASLVLLLALRMAAGLPRIAGDVSLALLAAAAAIAFVEHGAWQAWWTAGLGAAITWLREGARLERERAA